MERRSRQRQAIREALLQADRPLSNSEILAAARRRAPRLGVATVYRAIKRLVAQGWLRPVPIPGAPPRYEVNGKDHHHHFHCRRCGRVYEIAGCGLRKLAPPGFRVEAHEVILYGRCRACARH
jgi:Fur family ferric uptake transcriptional regulator